VSVGDFTKEIEEFLAESALGDDFQSVLLRVEKLEIAHICAEERDGSFDHFVEAAGNVGGPPKADAKSTSINNIYN
jgi:hypothetical protein